MDRILRLGAGGGLPGMSGVGSTCKYVLNYSTYWVLYNLLWAHLFYHSF